MLCSRAAIWPQPPWPEPCFLISKLSCALPCIGGILLPETPNSLIERGHLEEARRVLKKIRGTENINVEYEDIVLVRPWKFSV
jgi:Sugar (and other) transporter